MNETTRANVALLIQALARAGTPARRIAARLGVPLRTVRTELHGPPPPLQQPLVAATRDAGFYLRPDTRTAKRWHIATTVWTAACQPGPTFTWGTTLLDEAMATEPNRIYTDLRCGRPGCRRWWAHVPPLPR